MEFQQKLKCALLCSDASRISKVVLDEPMLLEMGVTFQGNLAVGNCKRCGHIQYFMDKPQDRPPGCIPKTTSKIIFYLKFVLKTI